MAIPLNCLILLKKRLTNRYNPAADLTPIYIRALDLARASVEVVAFSTGYGLSVSLEKIILPDGTSSLIVARFDDLAALCSAYTLSSGFDDIHRLVLADHEVRMALHDLIEANSIPHASTVNCARHGALPPCNCPT